MLQFSVTARCWNLLSCNFHLKGASKLAEAHRRAGGDKQGV